MLLNISSSPISHRIHHSLSNFNNLTSNYPPKPKIHLPKSHLYSNHTKNRALPRNKRHRPPQALAGFDFGSFESVLEASAVLTAIIVVHETGHFLAATLQGIHVSKFAIGFGPILAKLNSKNVEYSLRAFPLDGFVGFPDNDPDSQIPLDDKNLLKNRPILDRVIVVSAGIIANVIFAYAIIFTQVVSVGLPVQESFPGVLVPDVKPFSAGLLPGDVILAVDGVKLPNSGFDSVSKVVDVVKQNPNPLEIGWRSGTNRQTLVACCVRHLERPRPPFLSVSLLEADLESIMEWSYAFRLYRIMGSDCKPT